MGSPLRFTTPLAWVQCVLNDFDSFLLDHAAAEKKASGMAISLISHYPDKTRLVEEMAELAIEELNHYREVIKVIHQRGLQLAADEKDPYIQQIREQVRNGKQAYFMDRLVCAGIIEARGAERFALVAQALPEGRMKNLYLAIANSEKRHYRQFIDLANVYFEPQAVTERADQLLDIEASIVESLPIRARLH